MEEGRARDMRQKEREGWRNGGEISEGDVIMKKEMRKHGKRDNEGHRKREKEIKMKGERKRERERGREEEREREGKSVLQMSVVGGDNVSPNLWTLNTGKHFRNLRETHTERLGTLHRGS